MPLVVPGVTTNSSDKTEEWQNKLIGKKLSDTEHNEVVRLPRVYPVPELHKSTLKKIKKIKIKPPHVLTEKI